MTFYEISRDATRYLYEVISLYFCESQKYVYQKYTKIKTKNKNMSVDLFDLTYSTCIMYCTCA